jgi:hypothetical protein
LARRYHFGMAGQLIDPTIAGALIAGGAALVGFAASAWTNARNVRAHQEAAREQRKWETDQRLREKRSALYETVLVPLMKMNPDSPGGRSLTDLHEIAHELEALMAQTCAYASDEVMTEFMEAIPCIFAVTDGSDPADLWSAGAILDHLAARIRAELLQVPSLPRPAGNRKSRTRNWWETGK